MSAVADAPTSILAAVLACSLQVRPIRPGCPPATPIQQRHTRCHCCSSLTCWHPHRRWQPRQSAPHPADPLTRVGHSMIDYVHARLQHLATTQASFSSKRHATRDLGNAAASTTLKLVSTARCTLQAAGRPTWLEAICFCSSACSWGAWAVMSRAFLYTSLLGSCKAMHHQERALRPADATCCADVPVPIFGVV